MISELIPHPYAFQAFHPRAGSFPVSRDGPTVGAVAAIPVRVAVVLVLLDEEERVEVVLGALEELRVEEGVDNGVDVVLGEVEGTEELDCRHCE